MQPPEQHPLTAASIESLPDEDLDEAAFLQVVRKLESNGGYQRAIVMALSRVERMVFTTTNLELQVRNGGFNQYFWNPTGQYVREALAGYLLIGAELHAALVDKAIETFAKEEAQQQMFKREGTLQAFSDSYKHSQLDPLDREFYALDKKESARALRVQYIRVHPSEFIDE